MVRISTNLVYILLHNNSVGMVEVHCGYNSNKLTFILIIAVWVWGWYIVVITASSLVAVLAANLKPPTV